MRRVVVTGLGLLTPLGQGVDVTWKNILAGKSGANRISAFDPTEYACQVACEVPRVDGRGGGGPDVEGAFNPDLTMRGPRRVSPFFISSALINLISGQVSIRYGFKGPNHAVVTACSTGAHAIGDAPAWSSSAMPK
jgi:3-oxoacyl-(acyl-carrier-protein) synthase